MFSHCHPFLFCFAFISYIFFWGGGVIQILFNCRKLEFLFNITVKYLRSKLSVNTHVRTISVKKKKQKKTSRSGVFPYEHKVTNPKISNPNISKLYLTIKYVASQIQNNNTLQRSKKPTCFVASKGKRPKAFQDSGT